MNAFQAAQARLDELTSARPFPVMGDAMAPTLTPCRDIAMVKPCDRYIGEGIYAIESLGQIDFVRVDVGGPGKTLRLIKDNKRYRGGSIDADRFDEIVLGKVFGVVSFFCPHDFASFVSERCSVGAHS